MGYDIINLGLYDLPDEETKAPCSQVRIITWNIDFVAKNPEARLIACLRHIERDVLQCKEGEAPEPCCILFQEVLDTVIPYLLCDAWVSDWFIVTPYSSIKWPKGVHYGNITLVSRSLSIVERHILHYGRTKMGRTALCIRIRLNYPEPSGETAIISVVNTHLESLAQGTVLRPHQLKMCSQFLRLNDVAGGIVAGDMNAIMPEDEGIETKVGLRDAWCQGSADVGKTWGYQSQNRKFPCARLDKVFYLPGQYKVDEPRRIGIGVKTRGSPKESVWASDHYGLETTLHMVKRIPEVIKECINEELCRSA